MSKQDVCIVVATPPEAIKMARSVMLQTIELFASLIAEQDSTVEILDQALRAFGLQPDVDLDLMQAGQTLADVTARVVTSAFRFLDRHRPAAVLVQGDTTTVLGASLAAFYAGLPVGHVEAGLRTHNLQSPWPEEMNRRLVAPLARWHFCPTSVNRRHLLNEGVPDSQCYVTGNTVIDALTWMRRRLADEGYSMVDQAARLRIDESFVRRFLTSTDSRWILVTGHRRESHGDGLARVCESILRIAREHPDVGVLFPVHLNPRVRQSVLKLLSGHERIALIDPVGYEDFIALMSRCMFLISDSGGVQEEAPSFGKPVLVTRETTERSEAIEAGTCRLVGTDPDVIFGEADLLLRDRLELGRRSGLRNPYGDGTAAQKICEILEVSLRDGAAKDP
ncbi:MAG: UDP-N-acetylglucosamine 2-epimerase (non-hydrolyzing) [Pirellulaceae bacterium]